MIPVSIPRFDPCASSPVPLPASTPRVDSREAIPARHPWCLSPALILLARRYPHPRVDTASIPVLIVDTLVPIIGVDPLRQSPRADPRVAIPVSILASIHQTIL